MRDRNLHELKSYPYNFQAVVDKTMSFQLRLADRDYQIGDILFLKEFTESGEYTGRTQPVKINNMIIGDGLEDGYVILNMGLLSLAIIGDKRYESKL